MYGLWLSQISGLTPIKINKIMESCSSAEELYYLKDEAVYGKLGLEESDAKNIIDSRKTWNLREEWGRLQERGVSFICQEEDAYPQKLRNIYGAPYGLFYIGGLPKAEQVCVSIVGARECSAYGSQIAYQLGRELAQKGVAVISGMARGIDANGHKGALEGKGQTFAVLGCGVDVCYPKQNMELYENIPKNGGILSEYPIGTSPKNIFFPQRNRIISGLSDYVVVIEARKRSGSLITADFAMEQGREVFALPGRICDPLSQGCNELIRQGAGILTGVKEFLTDVMQMDPSLPIQMDFKNFLLEKEESLVYSLFDFAPLGIGTLIEKSHYPLAKVLGILERLEQKGFVEEVVPNYYIKKL